MITIWENKLTENPSIQVGRITIDLGKETPAQSRLFALVMNHPDTEHTDKFRGPVTHEIGDAFEAVLREEIARFRPKGKMKHSVEIKLTGSKS